MWSRWLIILVFSAGCDILTDGFDGPDASNTDLTVDPNFGPTVPDNVPDSDIVSVGERCEGLWCEAGTVCLPYPQGSRCSVACDISKAYCADGALCVELVGLDYGACASYGVGDEGARCDNSLDCSRSLACVSDAGADAVCTYTCDFGDDAIVTCPQGWSCSISTAGVDYGLCLPNP